MKESSDHTSLFKQAMSNYPTGVSIVTGIDENSEPIGLTVNSLASVSLDPLLILWSVEKSVSTYETFRKIDTFAVNILSGEQKDIAFLFASQNQDGFLNCDWSLSKHGLPLISNAAATFECKTFKHIDIGDHTTLFGEIFDINITDNRPLLYHQRKIDMLPDVFHKD